MSQEFTDKRRHVFGGQAQGAALPTASTLDVAAVKAVFAPASPIDVYRWGFILSSTFDAGSFAATLAKADPIGGGSPVVAQTLTAVDDKVDGDVIYVEVVLPVAEAAGDDTLDGGVTPQTSRVNVGPAGPLRVNPGERLRIEVTVPATAGDGYAFIEYVEFDVQDLVNVVRVTGTP